MKRRYIFTALLLALCLQNNTPAQAWGSWGHQHINAAAVFALPPEMRSFFYNHLDFLTEEAVVPDLRKHLYNDHVEGPKHFVDLEGYNISNFNYAPKTLKEAKDIYGDKLVSKGGSLPWQILSLKDKLTEAFRNKNKAQILLLAGDLGHYMADATQPLHTTHNYDGQMSGLKGIHSFYESKLPVMFGNGYNFNVGNARYIKDMNKEVWSVIQKSNSLVPAVLQAGTASGVAQSKSQAVARTFNQQLKGMVEQRIREAVIETASIWYTAWMDAGKPNLNELDPSITTERNNKNLQQDLKLLQQGKLNPINGHEEEDND